MGWTNQQQNAIDARDSSIIVSAAAGSGKTAVLTERIVKLISDPASGVRADRMVVVTFTNDAAAELKKRLDMKLRSLIAESGGDPYLLKQQALIQNAKISTINSFCFEFLRDNITDQGVTSGFGVLDDNDDKVIRAQAMDELLDRYSRDDYDTISYLYDRFCVKEHTPLVNAITALDDFLSSVAMRDKWLDKAVSEYKKPFAESVYYGRLFDSMKKKLLTAVRLAEANLAMVKDIFPDMTSKQADAHLVQAQEELVRAETILALAERRRFPDADEKAMATEFPNIATIRGLKVYNKTLRDIYAQRRNKIKSILASAVKGLESAESDFAESGKVAELLADMVRKYHEIIWEIKCAKNSISFDDGERLALEILADFDENGNIVQSEAARRTAEYYDIVMIDEYQDSNNKEDLIFKLISRNFKNDADGRPMYGDNAFVVGDVKQSIYGFRLANPRNFRQVINSSEPYDADSPCKNKSILLNKNFRSSPEVIDFVNFIFTEIMSPDCGDIDYNADEMLYFGAEQYSAEPVNSRLTHITFLNADPPEDDDAPPKELDPEAEVTAERIAKMLRDEHPVTLPKGGSRPCTPSDFCILVRSNKETKPFEAALEKHGIPAKGSEEKGYLKSREIAVLIDLLKVIANPLLDVPMAAVLMSPMYTFTVEELARLKVHGRKVPLFTLLRSAAAGELADIDVQLSARCGGFLNALEDFRLDSVTMTIGELISSIYDTTDFISVMQLHKDGEKKRANLRALIQYAEGYETYAAADGSGGLSGFLRHIQRISENGDYEQGRVSASSGDYVSILTDHKSKGLEFPFVFIGKTSHKFRFDSANVMCSDDGMIGFILHDKSIARKYRTFQQIMLTEDMKQSVRSEEMRLLYVAMTRAKQQLFVDLDCGEKTLAKVQELINSCIVNGSDITELVEDAPTTAQWLWLCLMMHGDFPAIAQKLGIDSEPFGFPAHDRDEMLFNCEFSSGAEDIFQSAAAETEAPAADDALVAELSAMIADSYDRTLSETTAKLSVTQISRKLRDDEQFDFHLQRPRFLTDTRKLTGAERGTAIHTFFQYCDFDRAIADAKSETDRMKSLGFLTEAQSHVIKPENVRAFFRSGLYQRLSKSISFEREKKFTVAAAQLDLDAPVFDRLRGSDGMIKGIIDLMFEEPEGLVIVDYKSDMGMSAEELRVRYSNQLEIYRGAIELTTGKKVSELWLYSIELEQEIRIG